MIPEQGEGLTGESLPRRIAAALVDTAILVVLTTALVIIASYAGAWRSALDAFAIALWLLYFVVSESLTATTPGKRLFGLYVLDEGGQRAEPIAHVIRALTRLPEALLVLPYLVLIGSSPRHQRLGDVLANTVVLRPKTRP
ncbi:MAG: RDD family protein [Thermoleophilia bacterium]